MNPDNNQGPDKKPDENSGYDLEDPTEWVLKDRKRSILTRDDRDYIRNIKKSDRDEDYQVKNRIRHRVDDGIRDLAFLSKIDYTDPLLHRYIPSHFVPFVTRHALRSVLTYWSSYVIDHLYQRDINETDDHIDNFLELIESVIADVLERGTFTEVRSVDIDINGVTDKESYLRQQLLENDTVTTEQLERYQELADDERREELADEMNKEGKKLKVYDPWKQETKIYPLDNL